MPFGKLIIKMEAKMGVETVETKDHQPSGEGILRHG